MEQPVELRSNPWSFLKVFAVWTGAVYAVSLLSVAPSQGWLILRAWRFHLTFLIPAIVVGVIGALVITNSAPMRPLRSALRGAATGVAAGLIGAVAACLSLTKSGSEGQAWFGVLQVPVIAFAAVTGFVVGMMNSREARTSDSA